MFRLLKLAFFGVLIYALYEMFQGMNAQSGGGSFGRREGAGSFGRARGTGAGAGTQSGATMTGGGEGMREDSLDAGGGSTPHTVGRGVIS